jgi:lysyl-tRNA synthetase class 2
VSVADLFRRHLGMDLRGVTTPDALRAAAREARWPEGDALPGKFEPAFSRLWIDVETHFPREPFLVVDWPAPLASLARLKPGDPTLAERMELYAGGLEIANGFAELTDAAEQRARFEANLVERAQLGLPPLQLDEAFLRALEDGMPPSSGMALGLDRLVMLAAGVGHIREVLPFAYDEL